VHCNGIFTITGGRISLNQIAATQVQLDFVQSGQTQWTWYQSASSNDFKLWNGVSGDTLTLTNAGAATFASSLSVSGSCTLGDAAGDAHTINGTTDFNHAMNVDGAVTMTSTLAVDGNVTLGNATTDTVYAPGYAGFGVTPDSSVAVYASGNGRTYGFLGFQNDTGVAGDRVGCQFHAAGSADATAATRNAYGLLALATTTRSAGANNVINHGVYASASGAQVNYSFFGAAGTLYNAGDTYLAGSVVLGDAAADTITAGGGVVWARGTGSPEGVVTANVGSFYSRTDGGASTSWYVKESGTGNTGWVAK
jgi:hypothetical protein